MEQGKFKAALLQLNSTDDVDDNLSQIQQSLIQAADMGADLAVLPETADYIGQFFDQYAADQTVDIKAFLAGEAKKHGLYLHGGSFTEKGDGGKLYNTSLFFLPDGQLLGQYRKLHMFDIEVEDEPAYRESDTISPGDEIVMLDSRLGMLGMAICYDLRFPELFRLMAQSGAQIIILPANFTSTTGAAHWETLLRARAVENGCYVLSCDQCGQKPAFTAYGHSMVVNPWGEVIARAGTKPECITAEIDLAYLHKVRREVPVLGNIRSDIYQLNSRKISIYREDIK